jgi:hypothetical protein
MMTRGSVAFPTSNVEPVMVLATNVARMAALLAANAEAHQRATTSLQGSNRWTGPAANAFSESTTRRADQATRAATALRAVGEGLARHGSVIHQTTHGYEVAAQGEQYLRQNYPHAIDAISATLDGPSSAQHFAQSAAVTGQVVTEAMYEFSQMTKRAKVDASRPSVQRQQQVENFFDLTSDGNVAGRTITLDRIERGTLAPDPRSRLGAYAATVSYPPGSVGYAVHRAIGTIYLSMGTVGQEQIGTVFNSAEARALFDKPLTDETSRQIAELEYRYWDNERKKNPMSVGGQLGSVFKPGFRDMLQRDVFGSSPQPVPPAKPAQRAK